MSDLTLYVTWFCLGAGGATLALIVKWALGF